MDSNDPLLSPGGFAAIEGNLPQDTGSGTLENLSTNFSPNLDNLLPTSPSMTTNSGYNDAQAISDFLDGYGGTTATTPVTSNPFGGLLTSAEGLAGSAFGAFVTNPQNAATAQQTALANAQISSALSGQYFGYLLIGLVIFLVFGLVKKA